MKQITPQEAISLALSATGNTVAQIQADHLYPEPLSTGFYSDYAIQKYINTRNSPTLTVSETASYIGESEQRVYQLIRGGYLKTVEQNKPKSGIYVYSAQEYVRNRDTLNYGNETLNANVFQGRYEWFVQKLKEYPNMRFCFVTMTLKKIDYSYIREEDAKKMLSYFRWQLNKAVYKNGYTRYGKQLVCVSAIETDESSKVIGGLRERFHIHLFVEIPDRKYCASDNAFKRLIEKIYNKLDFGYSRYGFSQDIRLRIDTTEFTPEKVCMYLSKGERNGLMTVQYDETFI